MGFVSGTKMYFHHKEARKFKFSSFGNIPAEAVLELN